MTALALIPALDLPAETATELLASVIGRRPAREQQSAIAALGNLQSPQAHRVLGTALDQMIAGKLDRALHLDLMEAVQASNSRVLRTRLDQYEATRTGGAPLVLFSESLQGGNVGQGQRVVFQNAAAQCARCHAFGDQGPDVGPNLRSIGATLTREELLEALIDPSARIAPGYGAVSVKLRSGETVAGMLREETGSHLVVQTGSGPRQVAKTDIVERTNAPSSMPPMGHILSRRELRDVVEYLTTLRNASPSVGGGTH